MAVLGRLLVSSAERLDLPDLLSLDSYAAGDWKYFLKGLVGDTKPFILKGFDVIDPGNAIGTQSCSIRVADSITWYPGSNSGSFFHGLQEGHPQAAPLVPELRKNAVNYVYLTFSTFNTSVDTRAFWDPDKDGGVGGEFTQDINTESVLKVDVNVSTGSFPANTVPVAKITVGPVVITAIEDARDLMFRLGSGGINPNPFNSYGWRSLPSAGYERAEPPTQMLAGGVNPFQGADKNILTLKEWMDAVMSKLRELGGTTYWYDDTSSFSIITNFYDAVATAFKSKGKWVHDTVTPGLLTWTEDIQIKMTSDPRTYIVRQGSKQLADEQVMYLAMQRNLLFNGTDESVQWTNGQLYVNTIGGAVGLFANLSKGDYIKKANDTIDKWVRVEEFYDAVNLGGSTTTAAGARSVRIGSAYLGSTGAEKGRYDKGVYQPSDVVVSDRSAAAIGLTGGNFHWMAIRSDTIENVSNIATTNLSIAIDDHDGSTARVTATAHGLVDGDRVTIAGTTNFDGTYQVEVESANIFYISISGGPFADESGTAHYAMVTTSARTTPYGFQEESANHCFNTNDTIEISDTTNYDGLYQVSVRSATTFTIPVAGPTATETAGLATLARVIVRTEGAVAQLIQGQVIDIGGSIADNIRQYLGMDSLSQTAPNYAVPSDYNTLDGMQNYNGVVNENITARVSKLSAMMADKAQDKMVRALPSSGITSINNTTNGAAQEITFTPSGGSLTFITPGSDGQYILPLPSSAPGISLLANQAAYVEIDRNNPTNVGTFTVADIVDVPVGENIFLLAARLLGNDVYLWEGSIIVPGGAPGPGFDATIVKQNQMLKLVEGGTWSWDLGTETVTWSASAFVQVPGLANSANSIAAGSVVLNAGEVAYVDINRVGPGGALTVNVALNSALVTTTNMFIIARRETTDVIVGLHSMRLVDGESKKIYAGASDQTIAYIGATSAADGSPQYSSNNYVTDGDDLTTAIGDLDAAVGGVSGSIRWKEPVADFASLPLVGNLDGDVRLTLDVRIAYSWIAADSEWRPLNGTGGGIKMIGGGFVSVSQGTDISNIFLESGSTHASVLELGDYSNGLIAGCAFVPNTTAELTSCYASLSYVSGAGNLLADIYTLDTSDFNLPPNSAILATSNPIDITTITTDPGNPALTTITWPAGLTLNAGTTYGVYFYLSNPAATVNFNYQNAVTGGNDQIIYKNAGTDNLFHALQSVPFTYNAQSNFAVEGEVAGDYQLEFTQDFYLEVKGLDYTDNTIQVSGNSPIALANNYDTAYVIPNLTPGGPALTVTVDTLANVPLNAQIIARREGNDIIVGTSSTRLSLGQKTELYAQESVHSRNVIRSEDFLRSDNPVTWTGTELQFTTDIIFESLNTRLGSMYDVAVEVANSPITINDGQILYIAVDREAGNGTATPIVASTVPTIANDSFDYVIIARAKDVGGAVYLHLPLHKQVIEPGQTVRLGASGSGGAGNANAIVETIKNRLLDSIFDLATPGVFAVDGDNNVDGASTGTYSLITKTFEMDVVGETLVTTQLLDTNEFLNNDNFLQEAEVMAFWTQGSIDTAATYEVSRNGGNEWQTVTMDRVGQTELFRGIHEFTEEASQQVLEQQALATSDGDNDLDSGTSRQKLGQAFTVVNKQQVRQVRLRVSKTGSPAGNYKVSIVNDNAGSPGTSVLSESPLLPISGISAGTNDITVEMPDAVLIAGTYHIVFEADAAYRASYSNGVTEIALRSLAAGTPVASAYNGTVWSALTSKTVFEVTGIAYDLRIRITSGTVDVALDGYGALYDRLPGLLATGSREMETFLVDGSANTIDFAVNNFMVNPELLKVYDVNTGQVYRYGAFSVNGNTVSFTSGQFYDPGNLIKLVFDQSQAGQFDNSDANALLLATNHLGSTDPDYDRSIAGRGIFLRRPDGTLREIAIDDSDNIVVYSV